MHEVLGFLAGVVVVSGMWGVLARRTSGRARQSPTLNEYRPPPQGHRALVAAGACTMTCSCGWLYALPWPQRSRHVNRARLGHYVAVEQERLAQRLGFDAESMLDHVLTARATVPRAEVAGRLRATDVAEPNEAESPWPQRVESARNVRMAAEARRASAIARVEAARVLAKYTEAG